MEHPEDISSNAGIADTQDNIKPKASSTCLQVFARRIKTHTSINWQETLPALLVLLPLVSRYSC
jgi:hypothetical protein